MQLNCIIINISYLIVSFCVCKLVGQIIVCCPAQISNKSAKAMTVSPTIQTLGFKMNRVDNSGSH